MSVEQNNHYITLHSSNTDMLIKQKTYTKVVPDWWWSSAEKYLRTRGVMINCQYTCNENCNNYVGRNDKVVAGLGRISVSQCD